MAWIIEFDSEAADDIRKLDKLIQKKILRYLREKIATNQDPKRFGSPLRRDLHGLWKYRVEDYRIICKMEQEKLVVLVVRIGHRKNIYKKKIAR